VQSSTRAYTAAENARADAAAAQAAQDDNHTTIIQQAQTALITNRTFLAIGSPTNAQTLTQVQAMARQNNGIIRILLNQFDGTN
jgi:hypothetical protein